MTVDNQATFGVHAKLIQNLVAKFYLIDEGEIRVFMLAVRVLSAMKSRSNVAIRSFPKRGERGPLQRYHNMRALNSGGKNAEDWSMNTCIRPPQQAKSEKDLSGLPPVFNTLFVIPRRIVLNRGTTPILVETGPVAWNRESDRITGERSPGPANNRWPRAAEGPATG